MQCTWLVTTVKCRISLEWAVHVAGMGDRKMHAELSRGNYLDKVHSEKRDGDDMIIFISFYVE
jgi:hypothetical protein